MKKKIANLFKYAFFLGLGIFLVWWSLHNIPDKEWGKFKEAITSANYLLFIPVFLILSASHLVRALRWRLLMEPMGYLPSAANTFFAVMVGYLANIAVPRLGEVLKCTIIAKYEKVPAEKIVGTIVAERAFDVVCLGFIFIIAFSLQFDVVVSGYQYIKEYIPVNQHKAMSLFQIIIYAGIALAIIGSIIWVVVSGELTIIIAALKKILLGVIEGLISASRLKHKLLFGIYTITIWLCYVMATWIGMESTAATGGLGIKGAISCLAFGSIGMILTPGGIGTYAIFLAIAMEGNGIKYEYGIANGTIQWFAQTIIVLVVGFICLTMLPIYNKHKEKLL